MSSASPKLASHSRTLAFLALLASGIAHSQTDTSASLPRAEAAFSNDTVELRYLAKGSKVGVDSARASAGFFLSEDRDIVLDAALLFPANLSLGPLTMTFGPRAYAALLQEENNDVMAFSIGAQVRLDVNRRSRLAVVGHAFYAPDILTFGSADNLTDLSARAEIGIAPKLIAFAGMRWFRFDLTEGGGHQDLMDEVFVGASYRL